MMRKLVLPMGALILGLLLWEAGAYWHWFNRLILPSPSEIAACLWVDRAELLAALSVTALSSGIGFTLSVVVGLALAVLFSSSETLLAAIYPYAVFFQTVPIIAIAPLLVIWFGYGIPSVVASAFIVSIFPMIASSLAGFRSTDPNLRDLFRLYGATRLSTLLKLTLPYALPYILTGLRIVAGLAVIGTIVGEFMGGVGLGSVVDVARVQQRVDKVFAAVLLSSLLGLISIVIVDGLSWWLLRRWHPSQRKPTS